MGTDARNTMGYGVVVLVVLGLVGLSWYQMTHGKHAIKGPTATNNSITQLQNAYFSKDGNPNSGFSLKNKTRVSDE